MGRILIIDDERAIRRALREILEFEEFEVDEAENGKQGLDKVKAETYDIIFCDIKMPEMDGMEVLEEFKNANIDVPVIMISGHGNVETAVQAIKKGQIEIKNDKDGNIASSIGKKSFPDTKIKENYEAFMNVLLKEKPSGIKGNFILSAYLTSTMGLSYRLKL